MILEIEDQQQIDRLKADFQASEIYLYVNGIGIQNKFTYVLAYRIDFNL